MIGNNQDNKRAKANPLVSLVVTTRNSSGTLDSCLQSMRNQAHDNIEIIVVDNNSADGTKEIALKFTNRVLDHGPERSAQRNFGVEESRGKYVLIIDSDMELSRDVVSECVARVTHNQSIKAVVIPEESFGVGLWARCKKLERSFYVEIDWMEAARFFEKSTFEDMCGYHEEITGTEDYDLPQRIKAKYGGGSIGRIDSKIYHNELRINLLKLCKKKFYYGLGLNKYQSIDANIDNFRKQANIVARYKLFFSHPKRLLENPLVAFAMIVMKTCEFIAGGFGYLIGRLRLVKSNSISPY